MDIMHFGLTFSLAFDFIV